MTNRTGALTVVLLLTAGCAPVPPPATAPAGASSFRDRVGVDLRPDAGSALAIPPGVQVDDGLTEEEAVAVALWNNPDFQLQVAALGFARADLLEAGLLRNPVLSLLFPVGPKQLEGTLRWPIEALWERPRRVAAARVAIDRAGVGLEQYGLNLVSDVKIAYVDLLLAQDRVRLADQAASELEEINRLTQSRLSAGDISQLEARSVAIDAARARQDAARTRLDVALRQNDLRARLGLALERTPITLAPAAASPTNACIPRTSLLDEALASRPDVRAAELAVEEAGRRLGWERSRILALTAVLDANGSGQEGFEMGPGIDVGLPLFDRNQAGRARAAAEMTRASSAYAAVRQRVATELGDASAQFEQASAAASAWRDTVVTPLEEQVRVAERAYAGGDVSYLFVLDLARRLTDARLRMRESEADAARAIARTERAIGRRCTAAPQEITRGF